MNLKSKLSILSAVAVLSSASVIFSSCRKKVTLMETDIVFFGHKGSGSNVYNDNHMENTIPSFEEALETLDGIEFDIQMSLDGTIWIYHNHDLNDKSCEKAENPRFIPIMYDEEIENNFLCEFGKKDRIYKFSEVIDLWNRKSRNFPMTIDIKISYPSTVFDQLGGRNAYYQRLAKALADDIKTPEHTDKVCFEFISVVFLDELKKHENTRQSKLFYSGDEDMAGHISIALSTGFDGVSIGYARTTKEQVKEAQDKGLLVQLWTPYYNDELALVFSMEPDFIHTDDRYAKRRLQVN